MIAEDKEKLSAFSGDRKHKRVYVDQSSVEKVWKFITDRPKPTPVQLIISALEDDSKEEKAHVSQRLIELVLGDLVKSTAAEGNVNVVANKL